MEEIRYPLRSDWGRLLERPVCRMEQILERVRPIIERVRSEGDEAVLAYEKQFDGVELSALEVSAAEMARADERVDEELQAAIRLAGENIRLFHASQAVGLHKVEPMPGVSCWQKAVGIEQVGLYVPGGTAPLFSTVLMLGIPAKIAGCAEVILCTPPSKEGEIHPAILFAAKLAGVDRVFKIGGSQAIAAMALGTQTVPKVHKIFGPGNQYVTAAKQLVGLSDVAIDMPAGPSEVVVMADEWADATFVAADLLSQAEHGPDSQVVLVTTSEPLLTAVGRALKEQLAMLPRRAVAEQALAHSQLILFRNWEEAMAWTNAYAPEHLLIQTANYLALADSVVNAGSVFLGAYSPESAGDYASGTNHTLPTNGYSKAYSGVNLDSFTRKITFQEITSEGLVGIGPAIEVMARHEGLNGHERAVGMRLDSLKIGKKL